VFNGDEAMGRFKRVFKEGSKALVENVRNKWRHKHLIYRVFSKGVLKDHLIKGL
jgi:hypothetical protein